MDTSVSPNRQQYSRAEARWQVSVLTPHENIEGETESISLSGVLVSSREALPLDSEFRMVIRPPDRDALDITGRVVGTTICSPEEGSVQLGADVQFISISESDRKFLQSLIVRHCQEKIGSTAKQEDNILDLAVAEESKSGGVQSMLDAKMPVTYNTSGRTVKALGTRFSEKGCYMITNIPPRAGGVFCLQIRNPQTGKSVQVECAVVQRRRFLIEGHWGITLQFMNMTGTDKRAVQQIFEQPAVSLGVTRRSPYLRSKMLQPILKYFGR